MVTEFEQSMKFIAVFELNISFLKLPLYVVTHLVMQRGLES